MTESSATPLLIGLTGGIASGKSMVAAHFTALGVEVIDTDRLAREVVAPATEGLAAVTRAFGDSVLDDRGHLDRARMRARVFEDESARRRLEAILHPRIQTLAMARARASQGSYVILVVPLLVESGWDAVVDRVLVVDVPEPLQIRRLMARDGSSEEQAHAMLAAQARRGERLAVADDVIDNSGSAAGLRAAVEQLHQRYLALATA